jgi:hypothetical protein
MKKLLIGLCVVTSFSINAEVINLACQGSSINSTETGKEISSNKKYDYVNLTLDTDKKTLTTGDSYFTVYETFNGLNIDTSFYSVFGKKTVKGYTNNTINVFINRLTGNVEIEASSILTQYGPPFTFIKTKFNGTCQVGVHWQPKF